MYIDIKLIELSGFVSALQALRLPYGLECRSEMQTNIQQTNSAFFLLSLNGVDYLWCRAAFGNGCGGVKPVFKMFCKLEIYKGIEYNILVRYYPIGEQKSYECLSFE